LDDTLSARNHEWDDASHYEAGAEAERGDDF
jgi:hypothetical protein